MLALLTLQLFSSVNHCIRMFATSHQRFLSPVPCLGPRSTRSCGGAADLGRGRKGVVGKFFPLELKHAIPGYTADVFVMLELKLSFYSVSFSFRH